MSRWGGRDTFLDPEDLVLAYESWLYQETDGKKISLDTSLKAALKGIPVEWLNAVCTTIGLEKAGLKKDRVEAVAMKLEDNSHLALILKGLPGPSLKALARVMDAGGWIKYSALVRDQDGEDMDRYFWEDTPPGSTVGYLRVSGLLFVGRSIVKGRYYKVAVIPNDLRPTLARCLSEMTPEEKNPADPLPTLPPLQTVGQNEWCFSWGSVVEQGDQILDQAIDAHEDGDYRLAKSALRRLIRLVPEHIDGLHHLALYLDEEGKVKEPLELWSRAVATGRTAFEGTTFQPGQDRLPWDHLANRPFLRALGGLIYARRRSHDLEEAARLAEEIVSLDVEDSTGSRSVLISTLLDLGRDADAANYAAQYPSDFLPETRYGHALALYRLGRELEARRALKAAVEDLPFVVEEILSSDDPPPDDPRSHDAAEDPGALARQYWETDGHLWSKTPGALRWLGSVASKGKFREPS